MAKEKKEAKGAPAGLLIGGAAAAAAVVLYLATRAKAAGLARLSGRVTDSETAEGISDALIALALLEGGYSTYTGGNGNYSFSDVEPGSYSISFEKGGYHTAMLDIILVEGNNTLNIQLVPIAAPVANLYGVVVDAQTGYALQGVKVTLDSLVAYTDSSGYYSFTGLSVGTHAVKFEKESYQTAVY